MNPQRPNSNDATRTANRSRSVVPMSGLCSRCIDGCTGNCEVFKATFRGRELIYPGPFGDITAGGDKDYPIDYSYLNIQGYAMGARGLPEGVEASPDTATFPAVDTGTEYGWDKKTKLTIPRVFAISLVFAIILPPFEFNIDPNCTPILAKSNHGVVITKIIVH